MNVYLKAKIKDTALFIQFLVFSYEKMRRQSSRFTRDSALAVRGIGAPSVWADLWDQSHDLFN